MPILFFDATGIILHWLPLKQTVNSVYYANPFQAHLRNIIWKKDHVSGRNSGLCFTTMHSCTLHI
jgi:hypothetical protein